MKDEIKHPDDINRDRTRYDERSIIDGENCNVHPEELQKEKIRLEDKYQRVMEELQRERVEQEKMYQAKINTVHDDDHYKEDIYREKINQLTEQKAREDQAFEEKIARLNQEMTSAEQSLKGKISQIHQERDAQLNLIEDRMRQVKQEKINYDELYRIQLEKIRLDDQYQQRMQQIKSDQAESSEIHRERQEQLQKEKTFSETSFARSYKKEYDAALCRLKDMEDYTVADKNPDVRGWKVMGSNGSEIGRVDDLIVDKDALKVRYIDVDLDSDIFDGDRHMLIPIGVAEIDQREDHVHIPTLDRALVKKIPAYKGGQVTRDYEETLLNALSPDYDTHGRTEKFYEQKHFDDNRFYKARRK